MKDRDAPVPPSSVAFAWTDALLLGFEPMDRAHEEFVGVVNALRACDDGNAAERLAAFEAHAREHFGLEREWMLKTDFPSAGCHLDEHEAVLASVVQVREQLADGRATAALVRELAEQLVGWFPAHADHLDSALSTWVNKQRHGGAPVVLRRHVTG